ncbi:helix-turn-helix transcriptional regulator [Agrobacterium sp. a22-2]|uniref:TetR/AcrR family transcriptional regulator n=1 Tax=Agrobacterium sp. a22-2 TaxID=2283840 RepID=UPI001445F31D|nr:TetR/AcrR family transcriptional regulator [Agrobacterium sp. a22-2]NKN39087.1 helix-turn-helix transcriptional regulator [Agrobacterium sp. a22-2]
MRLFWKYGYEGVSISDLTKALEIAPPSLYAAFGCKADLFKEVLQKYQDLPGRSDPLIGFEEEQSLEDAVRHMLQASIKAVVDPEWERGCMISSGLVTCHPENTVLQANVQDRRAAFRSMLECKLRRWCSEDEAASFARYLIALTQGISIQARDGATEDELLAITDAIFHQKLFQRP